MNDVDQTEIGRAQPGIGDNRPPTPFDERKIRTEELIANANVWIDQCDEIESEDQAGRASDFLNVIREAQKKNEEQRKIEGAPLRDQVEEINGRYKGLAALLDKANSALKGLLGPWLHKKEAERVAQAKAEAKEAERLAQEAREKTNEAKNLEEMVAADELAAQAEEKAAQADATARGRAGVKGEVSSRSTGLRGAWKATAITDLSLALSAYSDHPDLTELLLRLASADARGGRRRIPGFKIEKVTSVA